MKLSKTNVITIKWIISFIIAIRVGTWVMNLLYTAPLNVWLARCCGAFIAGSIGFLCYHYWIKK